MLCAVGLQQQLEDARANREGCENHLLQQLQQLQALNAQQQADMAQVQEQKARLQSEVVSLGQHLMVREQELRQAQVGGLCDRLSDGSEEGGTREAEGRRGLHSKSDAVST